MHYLELIKSLSIKKSLLSQFTSLTTSAEGDLVPAVTQTISTFLRRKYFMTKLNTQFSGAGEQRLSGGNPYRRVRSACTILVIAVLLLVASSEPIRATFGTITQITSTSAAVNSNPSISGDGNHIVFKSSADLTGGNADGTTEIFLCDRASAAFTQITNTTRGFTFGGSINEDGSLVTLDFSADLTGGNPDLSAEIFLYDAAGASLAQVTNATAGFSRFPSISADGTHISFRSLANLTGGNADGNSEIFLYDRTTANLTQITNVTAGSS